MKWRIVLLLIGAVCLDSSDAEDGKVRGIDLPSYLQPMYFRPDSLDFWPYNGGGNLIFRHEDSIDLYCKDGFRVPDDNRAMLRATYSTLTNRFEIGSENYKLEEIVCDSKPTFVAKRESQPCGQGYTHVSIGYEVTGRGFKSIYEMCFDYNQKVAKYVKYTLKPGILDKSSIGNRPKFQDLASFGDYQFDPRYKDAERLTIKKNCITRGHLAPQADFFYGVEQIATFIFPNAAPQWFGFNKGNWEEIERLIRSNLHGRTLECYTGVLGVMPYDNKRGTTKNELYLDEPNRKIPVPKLFFRVAYEPLTRKGVVFVGVNNVFANPLPKEYIVCDPVTDKIKGIILRKKVQLSRGYFYACDFNKFRQKYPYLPDLKVDSLLFEEVSAKPKKNSKSKI